jgi:hypothetical protein
LKAKNLASLKLVRIEAPKLFGLDHLELLSKTKQSSQLPDQESLRMCAKMHYFFILINNNHSFKMEKITVSPVKDLHDTARRIPNSFLTIVNRLFNSSNFKL